MGVRGFGGYESSERGLVCVWQERPFCRPSYALTLPADTHHVPHHTSRPRPRSVRVGARTRTQRLHASSSLTQCWQIRPNLSTSR